MTVLYIKTYLESSPETTTAEQKQQNGETIEKRSPSIEWRID